VTEARAQLLQLPPLPAAPRAAPHPYQPASAAPTHAAGVSSSAAAAGAVEPCLCCCRALLATVPAEATLPAAAGGSSARAPTRCAGAGLAVGSSWLAE
jgi:hypothetical protein